MPLFSTPPATHVPPAEGVRLDGTAFALPSGLGAAATLVVVSFEDDAAPLAGQWARLGSRLAEALPGLDVLDLVVLSPRVRLLGDVALLGLRARAEASGRTGRTAVVYTKRKPFRRALGASKASGVTALLLRPDGEVTWRGDGEIDLHEVEALETQVQALLGEGAGGGQQGAG